MKYPKIELLENTDWFTNLKTILKLNTRNIIEMETKKELTEVDSSLIFALNIYQAFWSYFKKIYKDLDFSSMAI